MKNKPNLKIEIVKEVLKEFAPRCILCRKGNLSPDTLRKKGKQYFLFGVGEVCENCWKVNLIKRQEPLLRE